MAPIIVCGVAQVIEIENTAISTELGCLWASLMCVTFCSDVTIVRVAEIGERDVSVVVGPHVVNCTSKHIDREEFR